MAAYGVMSLICVLCIAVEAKSYHYQKREAVPNICSQSNNTNKVQCYCIEDSHEVGTIKAADCYLINDVTATDVAWDTIDILNNITKLTLSNSRGITLKYIPTRVFKHFNYLEKVDIRHGNIKKITAYAFSNSTSVEEITLRGNQIEALDVNAFANHRNLNTISLDKNNIIEINRNVFVNLPSLEKLYLTDNQITTIHDKAFIHVKNLKELEIDRNKIFSLNSETFSGLTNLVRLELSSNSLEVIGDNTFRPLSSLQSLNLESNHIQMLDGKAFHGLWKLISLSLSRNELKNIDNLKIFEGLHSLTTIRLKGNKMIEFKKEVLAPILNNFHGASGSLDIDENNFPCDCRLEWFAELMNNTKNKRLKIELENLKCYPDLKLKEMWRKVSEVDKSETQEVEEKEPSGQEADYEYYDDTQLDGKLFYIDVRDLLNCTTKNENQINQVSQSKLDTFKTTKSFLPKTTSVTSPPITTRYMQTPERNVTNHGLLDLSVDNTTPTVQLSQVPYVNNERINAVVQDEVNQEPKPNTYTTSRLATVSAKPNNAYEENEMASDEAKPDKLKAQRSIDMDPKTSSNYNSASRTLSCISTILSLLFCYSSLY